MSKSKKSSALIALVVGVLFIFVGLAALGISLMLNDGNPDSALLYNIIMYVGIGLAVLGILLIVIAVASGKKRSNKKQSRKIESIQNTEAVDDVEIHLDGTATYNVKGGQKPTEKYEFVTVGRRQSLEEKFEQIGQMGKTQFVIYMTKLFSLKGYEVQLTPVVENHCIDMIVKKDGSSRAVGCMLSNKVLCKEDIKPVQDGASFYNVDGVTVVTNMYFDRTSLEFARSHKMSLIDRSILSEQYMN